MADPQESDIWLNALEYFKSELGADDIDLIKNVTDADTVLEKLDTSVQTLDTSSRQRERSETLKNGFRRLGALLAVFSAPVPEVSNVVWGALDLIYETSKRSMELHHIVINLIEDLSSSVPRLRVYEKVFKNMQGVDDSMLLFYKEILSLMLELSQFTKRSGSGIRKFTRLEIPIKLRDTIKDIKKLKAQVEKEAFAANVDLHWKWHEEIREIFSSVQIQPKAAVPCRIVPYPSNQHFYGREEDLSDIQTNLAISKPGQRSFALHGLGGVGKTHIALKYIYDHLEEFPVVFWVKSDSHAKLSQSYIEAAKRLQLEPDDSQRDIEAIKPILQAWLSETREQWLVIFDNADDLDLLKPFWPPANRGTILITSRNPASARLATTGRRIEPILPSEGEEFFVSLIRPSADRGLAADDENHVKDIVRQLGYLPLAIDQVAHSILDNDVTLGEFVGIYKDIQRSRESFEQLNISSASLFTEHTLATVWQMSFTKLQQNSSTLLAILSCFDPDGIPESLLRDGAKGCEGLHFLTSPTQYLEATRGLLSNGLISKADTQVKTLGVTMTPGALRSIVVHRLVQETVFHQQSSEDQDDIFKKAVSILSNVFPKSTRNNFRLMHAWAECERYLPHVIALESRSHDSPHLNLPPQLAELLFYAAWYAHERRLIDVAHPLLQTAIKASKSSNVDNDMRTRIFTCLGAVYFESGQPLHAAEQFRQVISIREQTLSPNDILIANAYGDLANCLAAIGDIPGSLNLYHQALQITAQLEDQFTRRDCTFHFNHNMARAHEHSGNPREALRLHFASGDEMGDGLRLEMSQSGAVILYAIGNCYLALDDHLGIEYHTRALKIRKELVGDHYFTAISLHKVGTILSESGSINEANEAFSSADKIFQGCLEARAERARTLWHWARMKRELGEEEEASRLLKEANTLRAELLHLKHQNVGELQARDFDDLVLHIHK